MIVPKYWAEARRQHRVRGRQVTVRRFGWSNTGEVEAKAMADQRADEALRRILDGEKLARRELRRPYNGSEGVPIREEIIAEHGPTVITRNSYGALCLNTPNALFADIDFDREPSWASGCVLGLLWLLPAAWLGWSRESWGLFALVALGGMIVSPIAVRTGHKLLARIQGGARQLAVRRIERFSATHPDWSLRVYRTPAGYRVLATHRPFAAADPEVAEFFRSLGTDPIYARMCERQRCFRARVRPKPWRIGIGTHLKPRPGVWPVRPELLPGRRAWVTAYEEKAAAYAACQFEKDYGAGQVHETVRAVQKLHDDYSGAYSGLPIA
jgi:hypothetical protein